MSERHALVVPELHTVDRVIGSDMWSATEQDWPVIERLLELSGVETPTPVDNNSMSDNVLLSFHDYRTLRVESRETLYRLGIPSNPGFSDSNIIDGLAKALQLETNFPEGGDNSPYAGELFRDSLGEILGLELPPRVEDVVNGLQGIPQKT